MPLPDSARRFDIPARDATMSAMNLRRGFLRLTLVASVLVGILVGVVDAANLGTWNVRGALGDFAIGFGACWATYAIIRFLVIGYVIGGFKQ